MSAWLLLCRLSCGRSIPSYRNLLNLDRQAMAGLGRRQWTSGRGSCYGGIRALANRLSNDFNSFASWKVRSMAADANRSFRSAAKSASQDDYVDSDSDEYEKDGTDMLQPDSKYVRQRNKRTGNLEKSQKLKREKLTDSESEEFNVKGSPGTRNKKMATKGRGAGCKYGKDIGRFSEDDSEWEDEAEDDSLQETGKPPRSVQSSRLSSVAKNENATSKRGVKLVSKGNNRKIALDSDSEDEILQEKKDSSRRLQTDARMLRTKTKTSLSLYESDEGSSESEEGPKYSLETSSNCYLSMKRKMITEDGRLDSASKRKKVVAASDNLTSWPSKPSEDTDSSMSHLSESRFDRFNISSSSIRALHSIFKYERMTPVQEATFPVILEGKDVLAKARTGTGKTIAFLLPAIEMILKAQSNQQSGINPIYVLIVCPTRELAQQACKEATTLLQYHKGIGAQVVIGGNKINLDQKSLKFDPCQILVGTPGRLVDHIKRSPCFLDQLHSVKMFVLDEADHMLDMGFRRSLDEILKALPSKRQTLLFSATIPEEVHSISRIALRKDHVFIDTVGKDNTETHAKVIQKCIVAPIKNHFPLLYHVLKDHMNQEPDYKVLIFCTTARVTGLFSELFKVLGFNSREIHSRKTQQYRTRVSNEFRMSKGSIILFTSDVSARGVDYPNVTLVIQVGIPSEREQYIHRLGRTGRAGRDGEGLLLLAPWEDQFLAKLKDLPIQRVTTPEMDPRIERMILSKSSSIEKAVRSAAYSAWLGYYKSVKMLSLSPVELFRHASEFSSSIGFDTPPLLSSSLLAKMGLTKAQGIKCNSSQRW